MTVHISTNMLERNEGTPVASDVHSKSLQQEPANIQTTPKTGFLPQDPEVQKQIKALMKTHIGYTLLALIGDWSIIIIFATLSWVVFQQYGINSFTVLIYIMACFIIASRQRALECLIHEATHANLSRQVVVNDLLGWVFAALPLGHNLASERRSHVSGHHRHFWEHDVDPDFQRYREMGMDQLPAESFEQLMSILAKGFIPYVSSTISTFFIPKNESLMHLSLRLGFWCSVVAMCALGNLLSPLLLYWFVPFLTFLTVIRYIGEASEHAALGCTNEFQSTRNNLGWFNEYFIHPHGDGYHVVHHLYAKIPFYQLGNAHRLLMKDPVYAKQGHHCSAFISADKGAHSTFSALSKDAN